MMTTAFCEEALRLLRSGLSVIPIRGDGTKAPLFKWKVYENRRPTDKEARGWFTRPGVGIATIGGRVSGNLLCLDFETAGFCERFVELAREWLAPLVESMPLVMTPGGGAHLWLRSDEPVDGNEVLAQRLIAVTPEQIISSKKGRLALVDGKQLPLRMVETPAGPQEMALAVAIETRGEGGYAIVPPSPGGCHPSGQPYLMKRGDLAAMPVIAAGDVEVLLELCRSLTEWHEPARETGRLVPTHTVMAPESGLRPGEDYNRRGDYEAVLEEHGWQPAGGEGKNRRWRRPGKERGISATTEQEKRFFYCFTSNGSPFELKRAYNPFAVYALLVHDGDFAAAARELAREGYGQPTRAAGGNRCVVGIASPAPPKERPADSSPQLAAAQDVSTMSGDGRPCPAMSSWPEPPDERVYHGVAGELVRAIEPHTEADPIALLIQILVTYGSMVGRKAYFKAEADRHYPNLFATIVGATAKGRKGTSWGYIAWLFDLIDDQWAATRVASGLSSGEGLIYSVRDPVKKEEPIKEKGRVLEYQTVVEDAGIEDKRLLVFESEFASTLKVLRREGNTLSPVVRNAWDRGDLTTLTKSPLRARGAHISIIGHITKDELVHSLEDTEAGNGFANRFLWFCVRRSKKLPEGGHLDTVPMDGFKERLVAALRFGQSMGLMQKDEAARVLWAAVYPELSEGKTGLLGAVTSRAEAQVMRLALIYALLDCSDQIKVPHLQAALGLWEYAFASVSCIFGDSLGDPIADELLRSLRASPDGMTQTEISDHFGRNTRATELRRALSFLAQNRLVAAQKEETGGRPAVRWIAVREPK